jgi:Asp/Glu/hydantoin racemase
MPRIALIHAVYVAMEPVIAEFRTMWPEARCVNLIDDALPPDLEADGELTPRMNERIVRLARHAVDAGAHAVLFTCSAFGPAIDAAAAAMPVPVLRPNQAMFEEALSAGSRIGMLATFGPSVASMEDEFHAEARARGVDASLQTICIPEALIAAKAGDYVRHNALLSQAAGQLAHCDAVMLAHFSTTPAAEPVRQVLACPILTSPAAAVGKLRRLLGG